MNASFSSFVILFFLLLVPYALVHLGDILKGVVDIVASVDVPNVVLLNHSQTTQTLKVEGIFLEGSLTSLSDR